MQEMLKELLGDTLQGMLETEMDKNSDTQSMTSVKKKQMTAVTVTAKRESLHPWGRLLSC